ncbi:MAG TPA: hypothetical protein VF815_41070, partial [Myxococcaceae bacterium]
REAAVLHVPHPPSSTSDEKRQSNAANAIRMHRKHRTRETELCLVNSSVMLNQLIPWLDTLVFQPPCPRYSPELLQELTARYLPEKGPSLVVGLDGIAEAHHLPVTHMLAHNEALRARLAKEFPERTVLNLLGVDTLLPDGFFEVAVLTDAVRVMPPRFVRMIAKEMLRVARRVLLVYSPGYEVYMSILGHVWPTLPQLEATLEKEGFRTKAVPFRESHTLLEISAS